MLHRSYIELLAVVDPNASSATLDRFLARYAGIHILAFAIDDPRPQHSRACGGPMSRRRPSLTSTVRSTISDPAGARARFELIQLPDQPEGRINLVRHLAPEALWQERFLRHANNATTLDEVTLAVAEPAETAARFSRLVGCVVIPDPAGGFALDLAHGRVRLMPPDADAPAVPCIVGLSVRHVRRQRSDPPAAGAARHPAPRARRRVDRQRGRRRRCRPSALCRRPEGYLKRGWLV